MSLDVTDLTRVTPVLDCRAVTFENPTGARGAGGTAAGGRKGSPSREVAAGERVTLADLRGPGTIRHIWMTFPPAPPPRMRAVYLEAWYDDLDDPSVSVPCLDFFGVPHGRPVAYASALTTVQEGRGFNSYLPIAFGDRVRIELVNGGDVPIPVFFQVDYTLGDGVQDAGRLHATFRRENPTVPGRDFVVESGLRGPGRFVGCVLGVRPLDGGYWYGEGEVKVYRDGDVVNPTICGTGLEDYVGSAWGLGVHSAPYAGAPLDVRPPGAEHHPLPDYAGCYRWHVLDPVMFHSDLTVTVQQLGPSEPLLGSAIVDRVDDYCATAFTVCADPQPVPRLDVAGATADLERLPYEHVDPTELLFR